MAPHCSRAPGGYSQKGQAAAALLLPSRTRAVALPNGAARRLTPTLTPSTPQHFTLTLTLVSQAGALAGVGGGTNPTPTHGVTGGAHSRG
eukprot:scaffold86743_cov31-Phaeocystis_antarctica.AAC.2